MKEVEIASGMPQPATWATPQDSGRRASFVAGTYRYLIIVRPGKRANSFSSLAFGRCWLCDGMWWLHSRAECKEKEAWNGHAGGPSLFSFYLQPPQPPPTSKCTQLPSEKRLGSNHFHPTSLYITLDRGSRHKTPQLLWFTQKCCVDRQSIVTGDRIEFIFFLKFFLLISFNLIFNFFLKFSLISLNLILKKILKFY